MVDKIDESRKAVVDDLANQGLSPEEIEKLLLSEKNTDWTSAEIKSYISPLGSFTNRPELKGKVDPDTGKEWKYAPDVIPGWTDYTKEEKERGPEKPTPPRLPGSLEGFVSPDYSDRAGFEKTVIQSFGENPFDIDPMVEVKKSDTELPDLFNHVFRGQIIWGDRFNLDTKEKAHWENTIKKFHSDVYNVSVSKKKLLTDKLNKFMNNFDNDKKTYEANLKKYRKQLDDWYKDQEEELPKLFMKNISGEGVKGETKPYTGGTVPKGWRLMKPATEAAEPEVGDPSKAPPMQKATRTRIEKEVMEADTKIASFEEMDKLFDPNYLTYFGRSKSWWKNIKEKSPLGLSKDEETWVENRQEWYQTAKAQFLAYRKWVTGVAGGEKEMAEIAKSYPDPDKNSPSQYRGNLRQAQRTLRLFRNAYAESLARGSVLTDKEVARMFVDAYEEAKTGSTKEWEIGDKEVIKRGPNKGVTVIYKGKDGEEDIWEKE
jgi:hypothetical protein